MCCRGLHWSFGVGPTAPRLRVNVTGKGRYAEVRGVGSVGVGNLGYQVSGQGPYWLGLCWGVGEGNGACQLLCSWRHLPVIPVLPGPALRFTNHSPSHLPLGISNCGFQVPCRICTAFAPHLHRLYYLSEGRDSAS